jgi:hypothetical protein
VTVLFLGSTLGAAWSVILVKPARCGGSFLVLVGRWGRTIRVAARQFYQLSPFEAPFRPRIFVPYHCGWRTVQRSSGIITSRRRCTPIEARTRTRRRIHECVHQDMPPRPSFGDLFNLMKDRIFADCYTINSGWFPHIHQQKHQAQSRVGQRLPPHHRHRPQRGSLPRCAKYVRS